MASLSQLDGLIQRIYSPDARYVLLSKVQFDSLWTLEIGTVGENIPRWWRAVLNAEEIPDTLVSERCLVHGRILETPYYFISCRPPH